MNKQTHLLSQYNHKNDYIVELSAKELAVQLAIKREREQQNKIMIFICIQIGIMMLIMG